MHATVRSVIQAHSDAPEDVCILDTEASPEHLSRGTAQYAETMLVVVEPYYKSLETGRRMSLLGKDLGIPLARMRDMPTLPNNLLRRTENGVELSKTLEEISDSHSLQGPDGVTLLVMANPQHAGTG